MKYISKVNSFKSKLIHYSLNLWANIYKGKKKDLAKK